MPPSTMKSRTVKRVSSRSPCASGIGVAAASRAKSCRLQIPMQRLLEPENPMRLDGTSEIDALLQIVRGVHVEHQQCFAAYRPAHRADALRLSRNGAGAGLQLD